jgi:hypothetical protein
MNERTLIENINKVLGAKWSRRQMAHGKWIEVKWDWVGYISKVVRLYKTKGWKITKHVEISSGEGRRIFLSFINPGIAAAELAERPHIPVVPR